MFHEIWSPFLLFLGLLLPLRLVFGAESVEDRSGSSPLISGFLDVQHATQQPGENPRSDVFLNDAALYFNHHSRTMSLSADLPVQATTWNNLNFTQEKVQLYLDYHPDPHWRSRWGQFDAPFGIEENDSVDNLMSQQGLVFDIFAPFTHLGWMGSYLSEEFEIHGIVADVGHVVQQREGEVGVQAGVQGTADLFNFFKVSPGFLLTRQEEDSLLLSELMFSKSLSLWKVDIGADLIHELGSGNSKAGVILLNSLEISKSSVVALRLESLRLGSVSEGEGGESVSESEFQITTGLQHKLHDQILIKANYTFNSNENSHLVQLAGLFQF